MSTLTCTPLRAAPAPHRSLGALKAGGGLLFALLAFMLAFCQAVAAPYDSYGGWSKLKGKKTGFFHTEEMQGRWWLVSPEGNAFISKGVDHVAFAP